MLLRYTHATEALAWHLRCTTTVQKHYTHLYHPLVLGACLGHEGVRNVRRVVHG